MISRPSVTTLIMRIFAGIAAGLLGMICTLLVVLGASFAQTGTAHESIELATSLSAVTILMMVFVGTLSANMCIATFLHVFEKEKYKRMRSSLFQVFLFTIVFFLFFVPSHLLAGEAQLNVASTHFLSSSLVTALLLEIMAGWKYSVTGLLGIIFSGSFLFGIFSLLFRALENESILLIFSLPLLWAVIMIGIYIAELIHSILYNVYGTAPLSPEQDHGDSLSNIPS